MLMLQLPDPLDQPVKCADGGNPAKMIRCLARHGRNPNILQ